MRSTLVLFLFLSCSALTERSIALAAAQPQSAAPLYVAPGGHDAWSGRLATPNAGKNDGPLASLERARDEIRRQKAAGTLRGPVTVLVRGGRSEMKQTFRLLPEDSGTPEAPVTYAAYPGEKPVLSGGRVIRGWKKGAGDLWQVELPDVAAGQWYFHQLFVAGRRAIRARTPDEGYLRIAGPAVDYKHDRKATQGVKEIRNGFKFTAGDLNPAWRNLEDVNVFLYHSWTNSLHWIERIDPQAGLVKLANPTGWPIAWWDRNQRYYVENVREGLDAPGEWYLDRKSGLLEYWPRPGEDMAAVEVVAPVVGQLVSVEGSWEEGRWVHDVVLRGLSFQHADWSFADKKQTVDGQSAAFLPGAVQLRGADRISLESCEIAHVGTYGLYIESGAKHNRVVRCEIHDLGAGGVRIGETMRQKTKAKESGVTGQAVAELSFEGTAPRDTGHNTIDNCFIHDGGHVFAAGTGVFLAHTGFNQITHNEICDFLYSGVCVGWVWGFGQSVAHHNRIAENHIHHLGWGVLSDMGGVYTLGPSPGTVVAHNYIHHVCSYSYGGWGLYTDEGSSEIVLENNLVHDTKTGGFHQHYGRDNVIRNNIFAFSREVQIQRSREDVTNSVRFERNLVYCDNDRVLARVWRNGDYHVDHNVYWTTSPAEPLFDNRDFAEWQATSGQDRHSLLADPRFVDPDKRDFRLRPDSPASKVGFQPFALAGFGLYGEAEWVARPGKVVRGEFVLPPTVAPAPTTIDEGFEQTPAGQPPAAATVSGESGAASIRITAEAAAAGKQSLKLADAAGLSVTWQPHFYYTLVCRKGLVRESFDVRLGEGFVLRHEWRDSAKPYRVGPALQIEANGDLTAGKKKIAHLPADQWVHVEIVCGLGAEATGTYDLSVTLPGQAAQRFEKLPCGSKEFNRLQWLGFISGADRDAVLYLDNLRLGPAVK